nr:hypothetical protein [Tanacetum cinerariifolium]
PSSYVEAPIVVKCDDDPFEDLDEILGDYVNTGKQITGNEITEKHMIVHVVKVDADNESEEERDTKGDYTSGSDSEDSDHDPKHDEVFDDDEHIVEDVRVSMNNSAAFSWRKTPLFFTKCRTPKSLTLEIHHGGCFTQIPSMSYVGGQT